jgi:hypothetical protein
MVGHEADDIPDGVPEDWVRRYGSRRYGSRRVTRARRSRTDAPAGQAPLTRLVTWLGIVTGVGAAAAWLTAGVPGIVAVVLPATAIGGCAVMVLRWLIRTSSSEHTTPD